MPKGIYRRVDIPSAAELKKNTRSLDEYQMEVVNIGIKYAKDIVKARKEGNKIPTAPLLMVHGGAGAGKSTVIKVLAQWMQKILQKEGDEIECPCVLKAAFTGTAASNIKGQTLHSSFGFSFDNKHYSLSEKTEIKKSCTEESKDCDY
jgi:energy-coupling factor transporter ATP-binding protein EcfA2